MASRGLRAPSPTALARGPELRRHEARERQRSFLRMVSHELRTPLNAIIGFSEIIARELYGPLSEPKYREHAEIVRDSGLKLLKLVNQVMEIARLETGAVELEVEAEPVRPLVEEAMAELAADAEARKVRFRIEARGDLPPAMADARALKTVLANLIQNAVAFSPEGGEVRVALSAEDGAVCIEVSDQGEGVDPRELRRLMQPFEQGEPPLTRRMEGVGLVRLTSAAPAPKPALKPASTRGRRARAVEIGPTAS
jgi:signal transduction histidine kinase